MRWRMGLSSFAVIAGLVLPGSVAAQTPTSAPVVDASLDARLAALDAYLADLQRPTRAYWGTWVAVLGALAVGQTIMAPFEDDRAARAGLIAGASFSAAGLVLVLASPTPGRYASKRFRALPAGTDEEKREKLAQGEAWLDGEAAAARRSTSWLPHVIAVSLGVGGLLGLGLGFEDNWWGAARTGVGALVVTELRVWTRPTRAIDYARRYRESPASMPELVFAPWLAPHTSGVLVGGRL